MNNASQFSPEMFLDMTTETALERREPLPVADYTGVIGDLKPRTWQSKDGSKSGIAWDVPITIDVPAELQAKKEEGGLELPATLTLRDSIMLDLTEQGSIDWGKGKNGKLRTYREATGLNNPGEPFSGRKLTGQVVRVKVGHELYQDNIMERVAGVSKL